MSVVYLLCVCFHYLNFFVLFFGCFIFIIFFILNLIWTPSVIRQRWIVGCRPPAAHPSPRPPGPQAGPRALCYHRGSCGLPAGWGSGSLWLLPSSSSFLLLLLSITSIGGGPSAFSANQLETGERCRLLCVHAPVCRVHSTTFFFSSPLYHLFQEKRHNSWCKCNHPYIGVTNRERLPVQEFCFHSRWKSRDSSLTWSAVFSSS